MADNITLPGSGTKMTTYEQATNSDHIQHVFNDQYLAIAAGQVTGMAVVNKFGSNGSIADAGTEEVWDGSGSYTFPSTADITHISQATDQAAMQGGTIEVQGLDTNWTLTTQSKNLDASDTTTAVALDTALKRVFRMKVLEDVVTDQDISAHNSGDTTTYATITAGNNQTLMAIYTVPASKTAYMTRYWGDTIPSTGKDPDSTQFKLWTADRDNSYEFQLKHARAIAKAAPGLENPFKPYFSIPAKTDIKITASPVGEAAMVFAGFDLILVDD